MLFPEPVSDAKRYSPQAGAKDDFSGVFSCVSVEGNMCGGGMKRCLRDRD